MRFAVVWSARAFDDLGRIAMLYAHRKRELAAALRKSPPG